VNLIIYTSLFLYQASNSIKILRYGKDWGMTIKIIYLLQMQIQAVFIILTCGKSRY